MILTKHYTAATIHGMKLLLSIDMRKRFAIKRTTAQRKGEINFLEFKLEYSKDKMDNFEGCSFERLHYGITNSAAYMRKILRSKI